MASGACKALLPLTDCQIEPTLDGDTQRVWNFAAAVALAEVSTRCLFSTILCYFTQENWEVIMMSFCGCLFLFDSTFGLQKQRAAVQQFFYFGLHLLTQTSQVTFSSKIN